MQRGGSFFVRLAAGLLLLTKSLCSSGEDTVVPAHGFIEEGFNPWFVVRILLQCESVPPGGQTQQPEWVFSPLGCFDGSSLLFPQ